MTKTLDRLETLGVRLPEPWRLPDEVRQTFDIFRLHGAFGYISGHGPVDGTAVLMHGTIGADLAVEDGYESARLTALAIAASLQRVLGGLDSVTWLRATVYVNGVPDLQGPALTRVADGFSDVIKDIFEERGAHARATIGVSALAFGVPTIIEGLVAVGNPVLSIG